MLYKFDFSSIEQLGYGGAFRQFQALMRAVSEDCKNRPGDDRARSVTVKFSMTPKSHAEQDPLDERKYETVFDGVDLQIVFDSKVPTRKTIEFDCGVDANGDLIFNPDSPLDHRQKTLLPKIVEETTLPMPGVG